MFVNQEINMKTGKHEYGEGGSNLHMPGTQAKSLCVAKSQKSEFAKENVK